MNKNKKNIVIVFLLISSIVLTAQLNLKKLEIETLNEEKKINVKYLESLKESNKNLQNQNDDSISLLQEITTLTREFNDLLQMIEKENTIIITQEKKETEIYETLNNINKKIKEKIYVEGAD